MNNLSSRYSRRSFALLELIVATALFAMAIAALGRATLYSIEAQTLIQDSDQLRSAVTQTAEEIIASQEAPVTRTIDLKDAFDGIRIKQIVDDFSLSARTPDGTGQTSVNMLRVQLTGTTSEDAAGASYSLTFYVRR